MTRQDERQPPRLRVLCLEDCDEDAELIEHELRLAGFAVTWERVDTEAGFLAALDRTPDIILADYTLPQYSAPAALLALRERNPDVPFIVVTGAVGEENAVNCIRHGADDYLMKDRLGRLGSAVKRALEERRLVAERRAADISRREMERDLRRSEQRFKSLVKGASLGICRATPEGRFAEVNEALVRMLGYGSEAELLDVPVASLYRHPLERLALDERGRGRQPVRGVELDWVRKDGTPITVRLSGHALDPEGAEGGGFDMTVEDITERRVLEDQFRQAQKMEALGRLAGGVAHDFNNLLTAILGFSDLVLRRVGETDPIYDDIKQIQAAGHSAAALTRQLLGFSRKSENRPEVLDLRSVVQRVEGMLRRVLGEDIAVEITGAGGIARVDPGQIEQVVMNLVVNARDAMPKGGRLAIDVSTMPGEPGADGASNPQVAITVTDTGCGMTDEVKAHLFEPFFSTKPPDQGTGLGLAASYAAVKQNEGEIDVESQPGAGTSVRVRFPGVAAMPAAPDEPQVRRERRPQGETILLVDDDDRVRQLAGRLLAEAGYHILPASNGTVALQVAAGHQGDIHLLLTDVVMPGINGRVLFDRLRETRPNLGALFMTGYAPAGVLVSELGGRDMALVSKPFTPDGLLDAVRAQIAAGRRPPSSPPQAA